MPQFFRIDEFSRFASGAITVRDRVRFTGFGFDEWFTAHIPLPDPSTPGPLPSPVQRLRYTLDAFGAVPVEARNVSFTISWSASSTRPVLYSLGVSYIPRPDETKSRVTDWDSANTLADKYIKGVIIEADTLGVSRQVNVQVDNVTVATLTIPATTKGRRQIFQFSFAQTKGRYFRLAPADSSKWQLYQYQWIFDEEPLELVRWETQELDHGLPGWKAPLLGDITLRSAADVLLSITVYNQSGQSINNLYTIPNTHGVKVKSFVTFFASKGALVKYVLTSAAPFALYREETEVHIMPWAGQDAVIVKPFGNDDLDLTRGMYRASGVAERAGGGEGRTPQKSGN